MKTMSEAAIALRDPDAYARYTEVRQEIVINSEMLLALLSIAVSSEPLAGKLLEALAYGITIGMEMEKQ